MVARQISSVILSEAKNQSPEDTVRVERTPSIYARGVILRFAQNDTGKWVRFTHAVSLSVHDRLLFATLDVAA
jgi:hypothetical protein